MRNQFALSIPQMNFYQIKPATEPDHAQEARNGTRNRQENPHLEGQWNRKRYPLPDDYGQAFQEQAHQEQVQPRAK
jgi:hypothetical protein